MNITASIPDGTLLTAGDEVSLQALVRPDGSFLVTRVVRHETAKSSAEESRTTLKDWMRKWAGAFTAPPSSDLEEMRRDAIRRKFGI